MKINIFNIIIICGVIQGLIFSFIVLGKKKYAEKSYKYLALLVLVISLSNLYYWFKDTGISKDFQYYFVFYIPLDLLILPLFYFFTCLYLNQPKKYARYLLIPFFIRMIVQILIVTYKLFLVNDLNISERTLFFLKRFDEYATISFLFINLALLLHLVFGYKYHTGKQKVNSKWLKQILYFGLSLCVILLFTGLFRDLIPSSIDHKKIYYLIWIGLSIIIYWLGYAGVYHLEIFNQHRQSMLKIQSGNSIQETKSIQLKKNRFKEIDQQIKEKKMFCDSSLSLQSLSSDFNLSEGYISQLINAHSETNFANYINGLRIEQAKQLLLDKNFSNYTIVAIALESGFNSKSAFYNAFKKSMGISPSEYQKNNLS
jgi:AraC-like DNA-binding protein